MSKPQRGRAWRRAQRARCIAQRESRLPDVRPRIPRRLWQLHTSTGEPLPVFHRESPPWREHTRVAQLDPEEAIRAIGWDRLPPDQVVTRRHGLFCVEHEPWMRTEVLRNTSTGEVRIRKVRFVPSDPCTCSGTDPGFPGGQPGMLWRCLRVYVPDVRVWSAGRLAKERLPRARQQAHRAVKNWKLLYTRHVKVHRARQLGFIYEHMPHEFGSCTKSRSGCEEDSMYAVIDDNVVWGVGATEDEAWDDARSGAGAGLQARVLPCSDTLFATVVERGGANISFTVYEGVVLLEKELDEDDN